MGIVSIKTEYIKELMNMLSVFDNWTKNYEYISFEAENPASGTMNILVFKKRTIDNNSIFLDLMVPFQTLEGNVKTVLSVKEFKSLVNEITSERNAEQLFIEGDSKQQYAYIWAKGGENRVISNIGLQHDVHYDMLDAQETLLDPVADQPVYACGITPAEARTVNQCALLIGKNIDYNPLISHVIMNFSSTTGERTYGSTDKYRAARHTCSNKEVENEETYNEEHGSFTIGIPQTVARLIKEMTPARKNKTTRKIGNSQLYISVSSNYGLVETPKGNIGFTYTPSDSRLMRLDSLARFTIEPSQQTANWGVMKVDGDSLVDLLSTIDKELLSHENNKINFVKLDNLGTGSLCISGFQAIRNEADPILAQEYIKVTQTELAESLGIYNLKYMIGALNSLRRTQRSNLGDIYILAPDPQKQSPLHIHAGISSALVEDLSSKEPNRWNIGNTASHIMINQSIIPPAS